MVAPAAQADHVLLLWQLLTLNPNQQGAQSSSGTSSSVHLLLLFQQTLNPSQKPGSAVGSSGYLRLPIAGG